MSQSNEDLILNPQELPSEGSCSINAVSILYRHEDSTPLSLKFNFKYANKEYLVASTDVFAIDRVQLGGLVVAYMQPFSGFFRLSKSDLVHQPYALAFMEDEDTPINIVGVDMQNGEVRMGGVEGRGGAAFFNRVKIKANGSEWTTSEPNKDGLVIATIKGIENCDINFGCASFDELRDNGLI